METAFFSKTWATSYETTRFQNPRKSNIEDLSLLGYSVV
jgi:hypothetical protein